MHRVGILLAIETVLIPDFFQDQVGDSSVEVVPAEMRVAIGRQHLKNSVLELEDRNIEGAPTEVVHGDDTLGSLLEAVSQRGRRGLIHDTEDFQPGNQARILGGLSLAVVEIGGDRDHRLSDLLSQMRLGAKLEFLEDHGRDLGRRIGFVSDLDPDDSSLLVEFVREVFQFPGQIGQAFTHKTFDGVNRALRVSDEMLFGRITHEQAVVSHGDDGGHQGSTVTSWNDTRSVALHVGNQGVGRAEVNADDSRHVRDAPCSSGRRNHVVDDIAEIGPVRENLPHLLQHRISLATGLIIRLLPALQLVPRGEQFREPMFHLQLPALEGFAVDLESRP